MPNANARPRKRAACYTNGEDASEEKETDFRRNAKRPKVLTKKVSNKKQAEPAATASRKPKPSKSAGMAKSKLATKPSASSSSTSVPSSSSFNAGCFSTTWTPEVSTM